MLQEQPASLERPAWQAPQVLRAWQVQAPFGYPLLAGKKFDIRVAAKFEGPEYIPGSTATNRIFIAGYELVPR